MDKLEQYIRDNTFERPTLVLDVGKVEQNYKMLKTGLGDAHIHYAVKANPQKEILETLVRLGSRFDAASMGEIMLCLNAGARPEHISFGNTIKRVQDIQFAYQAGIRLYAADAEEELEKIAVHAPGSAVFIRVLIHNTEAEWPLSRKFGCNSNYVLPLFEYATKLGLLPCGISFHIGSQTRHPEMWEENLEMMSRIWHECADAGFNMDMLNLGGGFPAYYGVEITEPESYARELRRMVAEKFGEVKYIMAEPGRGMVGNCGYLAASVLLVSRKTPGDNIRWVYLDAGRFNGLAETEGEAIKYQFVFPGKDNDDTDYCNVAGPTCDSADVLYNQNKVLMPNTLACGDKVIIKNCGAYTTTYSTFAFNGFPPLGVVVI